MRTVIRAIAPAPRRGVLALLDQPTFDAQSLPPIPAGVHGFIVLSLDVPKTYDRDRRAAVEDGRARRRWTGSRPP